jgi:hypothetical protein
LNSAHSGFYFFIGIHGLGAEGRFGIGGFCLKTKDTNNLCSKGVPWTTGKNLIFIK